MFNTNRYVLVTTTYNDQGVIIDTKAEDLTGGKWIAIHDKDLGECFKCDTCDKVLPVAFDWCPFCGHHMGEIKYERND